MGAGRKCPLCGTFMHKVGRNNWVCQTPYRHEQRAFLGKKSTPQRPVAPDQVAVTDDYSDILSAFEKFDTVRVMDEGEVHPDHFDVDVEIQGPLAGATGGFLAGIPRRLDIDGKEYTPASSLWHHLVYAPDGSIVISEERKRLYVSIVKTIFEGKTPVPEPTFTMLGGGPAAGKTTLKKSGVVATENVIDIAADDIKTELPEFADLIGSDNIRTVKSAGGFTHNESSIIAAAVQKKALDGSYNITLDGTGAWSIDKMTKKFGEFRAKGYRIVGAYVTCKVETADARAEHRGRKTKRYIDTTVLRESHKKISRLFPDILKSNLFDEISLYDTESREGPPVHILTAKKDKGGKIFDGKRYKSFLAKNAWKPKRKEQVSVGV